MTYRKLVRSRKARQKGRVGCGHFVNISERIYSFAGSKWICENCAIAFSMKQTPFPGTDE